ncbi:MAG: hypothetical protein ACJAWQ_002824, partial [Paraglaciecola sp.]
KKLIKKAHKKAYKEVNSRPEFDLSKKKVYSMTSLGGNKLLWI